MSDDSGRNLNLKKSTPIGGLTQASENAPEQKHLVVFSQVAPSGGRIYRLDKNRIVLGSVVSADLHLRAQPLGTGWRGAYE